VQVRSRELLALVATFWKYDEQLQMAVALVLERHFVVDAEGFRFGARPREEFCALSER
jgi:hypothetical protein